MAARVRTAATPWVALLALTLLYLVSGLAGLRLASVGREVTLFWPPSGLALAGLLLLGPRAAGAVLAGAVAVNLAVGGTPLSAAGVALGNTGEALLGWWLLERLGFDPRFRSRRDAGWFVLSAGVIAPTVAALAGASTLRLSGALEAGQWWRAAAVWFAGDAVGALVVAPLVLCWWGVDRQRAREGLYASLITGTLTALGLALEAYKPFELPIVLMAGVSVVWAGLYVGALGSVTACFVLCAGCVLGSAAQLGPFVDAAGETDAASLWAFLAAVASASLMAIAVVGERRQTERALAASEARFRAAFERMPLGAAIVSAEGRLLAANAALCELLRAERATLLGGDTAEWLLSPSLEALFDAGDDEHAGPHCATCRDAQGGVHECELRTTGLRGPSDQPSLLLHIEDVSVRLKAEREREAFAEQLVHAQRMESVGQLAGGIAHDFNNLLQGIMGNVELATLFAGQPDKQAQALERAQKAGERAAKLASQLLTFSRRQPLKREPTDLASVLGGAAEWLRRLLPEHVELSLTPSPEAATILADAHQLEQVLLNLCINARDAMKDGGTIRFALSVDPTDDGVATLQVTDSGPGIPQGLRRRVFEPFFTTKEVGRGTGLGLSVVYGIVQGHEGTIDVGEAAEGGARFTLRFPLVDDDDVRRSSAPPPAAQRQGSLRVLVAEDDPQVRAVVCELLAAEGHHVDAVGDGAQAVRAHADASPPFELVLLDVVMPRMGGREALERIRERDTDVPAILASGYSREELDDAFLRQARVVFLHKPYTRATLLAAIGRATRDVGGVPGGAQRLSRAASG